MWQYTSCHTWWHYCISSAETGKLYFSWQLGRLSEMMLLQWGSSIGWIKIKALFKWWSAIETGALTAGPMCLCVKTPISAAPVYCPCFSKHPCVKFCCIMLEYSHREITTIPKTGGGRGRRCLHRIQLETKSMKTNVFLICYNVVGFLNKGVVYAYSHRIIF